MKELLLFFKVLINPMFWIMSDGSYSKKLDKYCREQLKKGTKFTNIPFKKYSAYFGSKEFWVRNHPYASFTYMGMRPSRRTKILLQERYEESIFNEIN